MLKYWVLVFFFSTVAAASLQHHAVIYGEDTRQELFEVADPNILAANRSTAMLIKGYNLSDPTDGYYTILYGEKYGHRLNLCRRERFYSEVAPGECSGFLIGPSRIATAGHCVPTEKYCENWYWVFDYAITSEDDGAPTRLAADQVYQCAKIVKTVQDDDGNDFAIIDLDRPVVGRRPLKLNTSGRVDPKAKLVLIGNPEGMPTKVATGGVVKETSENIITAYINSYAGNSGSAVFNANTWQVEGILVAGENDFEDDKRYDCRISRVCQQDECRGESIVKASIIKEFIP